MSLERFFELNRRVGVSVADVRNPYVATAMNDELCRLFGRSRAELFEPGIFAAISNPDDLERERPMMRELLAGERDRYSLAKRFTRPNGAPVRAFVDVELIRDKAGRPAKAVGLIEAKAPLEPNADDWRFAGVAELEAMRLLLAEKVLAERDAQRAARELGARALEAVEAGTSTHELAEALGVSTSTVRRWTYRARHRR